MRRNQLIQTAILVVAVICGYQALESLISTIIPVLFQSGNDSQMLSYTLRFLVFTGIYVAAFFILVRFNRPIAEYIEREGRADGIEEDAPSSLRIEQVNVFYIVLVSLSLLTLIDILPTIIISIFDYFKNEIARPSGAENLSFKVSAIRLVIAVVLLFTARPASVWLNGQFHAKTPIIETISGNSTDDLSGLS